MTYHRLRRGTEAKQLFQEVTQWMEKNVPQKPQHGMGRLSLPSWAHHLDLQLLYREAAQLLNRDFPENSLKSEHKQKASVPF
jgi:hypothetical protein